MQFARHVIQMKDFIGFESKIFSGVVNSDRVINKSNHKILKKIDECTRRRKRHMYRIFYIKSSKSLSMCSA